MGNNGDPLDQLSDLFANFFGVALVAAIVVWVLIALLAGIVAPDDRPWHFFWAALLLLGALAVVLALIAPARPDSHDQAAEPNPHVSLPAATAPRGSL
ncbi:MAG: hypothetical protein ABW137_35000 [Mycobacterium sp.]